MTTTTYTVSGMSCGHCLRPTPSAPPAAVPRARAVTSEISALSAVRAVDVDLSRAAVTVRCARPLEHAAVSAAVYDAGCELTA